MSSNSENAKDPHWKTPTDLPGVKPEDYAKDISSANGSAAQNANKKSSDASPPDLYVTSYVPGNQKSKR